MQVQSKLEELQNGFESSMHVVHAFRNPVEEEPHAIRTAATRHTDAQAQTLKQNSFHSSLGEELETLTEGGALNLRGVVVGSMHGDSTGASVMSSSEPQQGGDAHGGSSAVPGACAKKPVKLKARGWHAEADACTGVPCGCPA